MRLSIAHRPRLLLAGLFLLFQTVVLAHPRIVTDRPKMDTLPIDCGKRAEIEKIINEAISLGAPIYNEGMHIACYRIYEWAAYKIIYVYGKDCPGVEKVLKTAVDRSHGDLSDTEKAWLMRMAFDKILGVPTRTSAPDKEENSRKG